MTGTVTATSPKNYFSLQRRMFKILGISFEAAESKPYKIYSRIFLFCTIVTYPLVQLTDVFKFYNNMDILSNILTFVSLTIMGLAKCMLLFYNRRSIGETLEKLECGVFAPDEGRGGVEEVLLIKKCIYSVNRQCILFIGSVYVSMFVGISGCIYQRLTSSDYHNWKFPLGSFSLFDVTHSPNYEVACCYQIFCVAVCFTSLMLCDMLISGILAHVSTQFVVLQHSIRRMVENSLKKMLKDGNVPIEDDLKSNPTQIPWKYLQATLEENIEYHTQVIQLAKQFEKQFSYLVMVQFLTSSGTLCFVMYYCSSLAVTDSSFAQYIGGAVDIAIQVFFYCYWGNEVAIDSKGVVDACYESDFVGTDLRFQKGLILMMQRSQRPIVLTAGKFTTLSLETYVWIIRASYSYFMVLHRLQ